MSLLKKKIFSLLFSTPGKILKSKSFSAVKEEKNCNEDTNRLLEELKNEDYWVRWKAAAALGELKRETAVPGLLEALKDEDYWVRFNAAEALGKIKNESAVPRLIEALNDKDFNVAFV